MLVALFAEDHEIRSEAAVMLKKLVFNLPMFKTMGPYFEKYEHNWSNRGILFEDLPQHTGRYLVENIWKNRRSLPSTTSPSRNIELLPGLLKNASSHEEFLHIMDGLVQTCISSDDWLDFSADRFEAVISRFLKTLPSCERDIELLSCALQACTLAFVNGSGSFKLWRTCYESLLSTMFPLAERLFHRMNDSRAGSIHHGVNDASLVHTIYEFCLLVVDHAIENNYTHHVKNSQLLPFLKDSLLRCFAYPQSTIYDRDNRFYCLKSISLILSVDHMILNLGEHLFKELVAVLTQTLGCLQQNYSKFTSFTGQDRAIYFMVATCLREISCIALSNSTVQSGSMWGEHWLFENSIDWLSLLQSDDEIRLQNIGLGIMSNLILVPESYHFVMQRNPNFLDMAFAYALDVDRPEEIRKESFHLINNFFVRFTRDHDIRSVFHKDSLMEFDERLLFVENSTRTDASRPPVYQFLRILENCLFFDRIVDVLENSKFIFGYPSAFTEFLLNLVKTVPGYINMKLKESTLITGLCRVLQPLSELESQIIAESNDLECPPYAHIELRQFCVINKPNILGAQKDILVSFKIILQFCKNQANDSHVWTPLVKPFISLIGNQDSRENDLSEIILCLLDRVVERLDLVSTIDEETLRTLIAVVASSMLNCNPSYWAPRVSILASIAHQRSDIFQFFSSSFEHWPDLSLQLQSSLSQINAIMIPDVVSIILNSGSPANELKNADFACKVIERISASMESVNVDDHLRSSLVEAAIYIAEYVNEPELMTAAFRVATKFFAEVLSHNMAPDEVVISALSILGVVFCGQYPIVPIGNLAQVLIKFSYNLATSKSSKALAILQLCLKTIAAMASNQSFKLALLKAQSMKAFCPLLDGSIKVSILKMDEVLKFYATLSFHREFCQDHRSLQGLVSFACVLLSKKRFNQAALCLGCIRNYCMLRENKKVVIADEVFLAELMQVLYQVPIQDCLEAASALLWTLLYDYQKARQVLKRLGLRSLTLRLLTEGKSIALTKNLKSIEQLLC